MNYDQTYNFGEDQGPDLTSLVGGIASLSVYRDEGADSSGSDAGSADSFAPQGSVIAEEEIAAQRNEETASATSSSSRDGLPLSIQKELVLAIEARGGIESVKTAKLLNELPQYKATVQLKTAVGNKISRWKSNQREKYESLKLSFTRELQLQHRQQLARQQQPALVHSSVHGSPAHQSPARQTPARQTPARQSPARPPLAPHNSGGQLLSPPSSASRARQFSPQSPPLVARFQPLPPYKTRPFAPFPAGMNATLHAMAAKAELVTVNSEMSERNTPFQIYCFENFELSTGLVANGFIIELEDQDPRHLLTKFTGTKVPSFEAFLVADNEVIIKKPAQSFTFLRDEEAEKKGLTEAGILDKTFTQPITIARSAIARDPERQFEYFRLLFPVALDNDILCPNAENGSIKPKVVPIKSEYNVDTSSGTVKITSHRCNILWVISLNDKIKRTTKNADPANELDKQANALFGKLARMQLTLQVGQTAVPPPAAGTSALVVSSSTAVASKRSAKEGNENSKRQAVSVVLQPVVAIHPVTNEKMDEEKAKAMVEVFAQANNCSYDGALGMLQADGATNWQTAVDLLVRKSKSHPALAESSAAAATIATHSQAIASSHDSQSHGDSSDFKSTVEPKASHQNKLEVQKKKREAKRLQKQSQMREQAAVAKAEREDTVPEAVTGTPAKTETETETIEFDNKDSPPSDALLAQDQPFSYGNYRDKAETDSDESMGSMGHN